MGKWPGYFMVMYSMQQPKEAQSCSLSLVVMVMIFLSYLTVQLTGAWNYWAVKKMSFSKKIKHGVKKAVAWVSNFEQTAAELAIRKKYDYVICGHIHQPQQRVIENDQGKVTYLNSGDWIENLTSLEYQK